MFKPGTAVYVQDCKVESKQGSRLNVIFTQLWRSASGRYADQGTKRLVLTQSGSKMRIVQEAMLTSRKWDGVVPSRLGTDNYTVSIAMETYLRDGEFPYTKYVLTHGPTGESRHPTILIDASGHPMEYAGPCGTTKLPFQCETFHAGAGSTVKAKRRGNQVVIKTCYTEDGAGGGSDCSQRYSIALPRGVRLSFTAK